jgi:transcriptional regulator with XRE-family HTH domain
MDFKQGGQILRRARKERGLTQEALAERADLSSNSVSRIERGLLLPALPTLVAMCNALEIGADAVLAPYLTVGTPIHWSPLAEKLKDVDPEKQRKIAAILDCLIETI